MEGWGRVAYSPALPAVMRVMGWCAMRLSYAGAYQEVRQADLARELKLSQPQVSRALATLREHGLVDAELVGGRWRYRGSQLMGWQGSVESYHSERRARTEFASWSRAQTARQTVVLPCPVPDLDDPSPSDPTIQPATGRGSSSQARQASSLDVSAQEATDLLTSALAKLSRRISTGEDALPEEEPEPDPDPESEADAVIRRRHAAQRADPFWRPASSSNNGLTRKR